MAPAVRRVELTSTLEVNVLFACENRTEASTDPYSISTFNDEQFTAGLHTNIRVPSEVTQHEKCVAEHCRTNQSSNFEKIHISYDNR